MGVEIRVEGLAKAFGSQVIWEDVTLTLPAGEISVMLGPSGTGKSVFLKTLVGLLKPTKGHFFIEGEDVCHVPERKLYELRKLFGVLFQDGALFGSMSLYDNIAFPLREHTKKGESEIKNIVMEKMELVGLLGAEKKLPGEISGGMRKRAGLARALVLDPEIILFDEPDSGLDPVRTAYLNQLIVDLNAQINATFLIVTHDVNTARTVPDNIGLLYRRHLAMFGPREMLLSSNEPVVRQFLNAQRQGPIGMAEEKDAAELAAEQESGEELPPLPPIPKQLETSDGKPRKTQRPPGEWLREHGVTPPPGSYLGDDDDPEQTQRATVVGGGTTRGGKKTEQADDGETTGWGGDTGVDIEPDEGTSINTDFEDSTDAAEVAAEGEAEGKADADAKAKSKTKSDDGAEEKAPARKSTKSRTTRASTAGGMRAEPDGKADSGLAVLRGKGDDGEAPRPRRRRVTTGDRPDDAPAARR